MRLASLRLALPAFLFLVLSPALFGQDKYNVHFRAPTFTGGAGELVTVAIGIDNQPERVTGFSFGVKHDAAKLTVEKVNLGAAVLSAIGGAGKPDDRFFQVDLNPASGGPGFTVALILSVDQASVSIPAGLDQHVLDVQYRITAGATGNAKVDISGDLANANAKVPIILDVANGVAKAPVGAPAPVVSANVSVLAGPAPFIRGDANQSGRFEVTDVVILLDYLFGGSSLPAGESTRTGCLQVFNVDGSVTKGTAGVEDGVDIDLADALTLIAYIFQKGVAPPAPFPRCGQPAAAAATDIACKQFLCR